MKQPIAILGGGNGGHQMAIDLALRGQDVILCEHPQFKDKFENTLKTRTIECTGMLEAKTEIYKTTIDFKMALREADLIYLVVPAIAHETFFDLMIPHLKDGHIIVIWAGDAGALRLAKRLREEAPKLRVKIAETNTLPYGTRLIGPSKLDLFVTAKKILFSAFPASDTEEILERVKDTFPVLEPIDNVLSVSFSNPNPTVHPAPSLLNTGRIQYSKGEFYLYREGITEATGRVIKKVYDETLAIARAFGFRMREFEDEEFRNPCSIMCVDFWAPFDKAGIVSNMKGPSTIYNRYIIEDLPYGLVHRSQLGDVVKISTPIIDSIVNLGEAVCNMKFWEDRTLAHLGLDGKNKAEIMQYVQEGH
ncbi:MAG: NAD/NADP octopine/nopaline dehydrogenase family protein [Promethearchaeota archaeon]